MAYFRWYKAKKCYLRKYSVGYILSFIQFDLSQDLYLNTIKGHISALVLFSRDNLPSSF